jgi:predicted nucleic acid-binding protein
MIVVDVNTIAYYWIPGELTDLAVRAYERDPDWVSTTLWRSEFRNILAGYLRRKQLSDIQVAKCLEGAESQMAGKEYILPSSLIMDKVKKSQCSAYDCEYIALADDLNVKLITSDKQILAEFPKHAISLKKFTES